MLTIWEVVKNGHTPQNGDGHTSGGEVATRVENGNFTLLPHMANYP